MKTWIKISVGAVLSFIFLFICVGYAALSDTLIIHGSAKVTVPSGLFIIDVTTNGTSNIDYNTYEFINYSTTVDASISRSWSTGTVTYKITVLNNTDKVYAYRRLYFQSSLDGYNGNPYISESSGSNNIAITTSFPDGTKVYPGKTLEFYATYKIGSNLRQSTNWKTLVNFQFGINVDSVEEARSAVLDKFLNILNSSSTYETLYDKIDDKFTGAEWTSNYIGNVTASTSTDSTTVNTLFAGHLQMVIDNVENPITVLIKHENVDNNRQTGDDYTARYGNTVFNGYGCEFTLYMTTSDLSDRSVEPPVYAAVFTCNRNADGSNGPWYMIGEPYEGTAQIVGYEGGNSTGSFDTGTWRSVRAQYSPSENYSYTIAAKSTIQTVTQATDADATAELTALLTKTKRILDENIYAGTGMEALERSYFAYTNASHLYTTEADGTIVVKSDLTRSQMIPYIKELSDALKAFKDYENSTA